MAAGTFTVSNLGMLRVEQFTAVINLPEAATLTVGAAGRSRWRPATGRVEIRQVLRLTLSIDHQGVDGLLSLFLPGSRTCWNSLCGSSPSDRLSSCRDLRVSSPLNIAPP
jgi:hypothetical protein